MLGHSGIILQLRRQIVQIGIDQFKRFPDLRLVSLLLFWQFDLNFIILFSLLLVVWSDPLALSNFFCLVHGLRG